MRTPDPADTVHPRVPGAVPAPAPARSPVRSPAWPLAAAVLAALVLLAARPTGVRAQSACGAYHVVRTSESLVEIAQQCGVTLPALLAANPGVTDQRDVETGHRLRIPDPAGPQPTPLEACGASYTVRSGDTLAEIAAKCGLTIPLLVAANPSLPEPLGIHGGLRIRIPNVSRAAVTDPATIIIERRRADMVAAGSGQASAAGQGGAAEASPDSSAAPPLVRVEGVLERGRQGRRCLRVRTADGTTTAIVGEVRQGFGPGDRVVLLGTPAAEGHGCQAAAALELRILYRAGG